MSKSYDIDSTIESDTHAMVFDSGIEPIQRGIKLEEVILDGRQNHKYQH
jgi:hypothetical protein